MFLISLQIDPFQVAAECYRSCALYLFSNLDSLRATDDVISCMGSLILTKEKAGSLFKISCLLALRWGQQLLRDMFFIFFYYVRLQASLTAIFS